MKKKDVKKLKVGDLLVVTGNKFGANGFAIGTRVRVVNVRNKYGDIDCTGSISGFASFTQGLSRKDVSLPVAKTPREELGYKVGDSFQVVGVTMTFTFGSIVELARDDGTSCPFFKLLTGSCLKPDGNACAWLNNVKPCVELELEPPMLKIGQQYEYTKIGSAEERYYPCSLIAFDGADPVVKTDAGHYHCRPEQQYRFRKALNSNKEQS